MGTEEEAAAALRKLREQTAARPSLARDDVSSLIDERLSFNTAIERFSTEYDDIWTDPMLKKLALEKDQELISQGDRRPYWDRYQEVGNELREWKTKLVGAAAPAKAEQAFQTKEERKAQAPKAPTAATGKAKQTAPEPEEDDSPQSVIAGMAKSRGGPQWMRN